MTAQPTPASGSVEPLRLHFTDSGGEGPPLVLIHGWACDLHDWDDFATRARAQHRIIALDLRGHGGSPKPAGGYDLRQLTADVAGLLRALTPAGAVVAGHSLGAAVATVLAVEYPGLVRAAVLVDPAYGRPAGHDRTIRDLLAGAERGRTLAQRLIVDPLPTSQPERIARYRARINGLPDQVLDASLAGLWLQAAELVIRPDADRYLARRRCPVLALHADQSQADWERSLVRHPASVVAHWPGVSHFLHHDRPEAFAATVLDWTAALGAIAHQHRAKPRQAESATKSDAVPVPQLIDVHLHVGRTVTRIPSTGQTAAEALARMRTTGTVAAILSPAGGDELGDGLRSVQRRNNALCALAQEHPSRFPLALADADPRLGPDLAASETRRALASLGLAGVCLVPAMSGTTVGPALAPILREVDHHCGLCLLHPTPSAEASLLRLVGQFRHVTFILAHAAMSSDLAGLGRLRDTGRVWFDASQNCADPSDARLTSLIGAVGYERVLFAGDSPYYEPATARTVLFTTPLGQARRNAIAVRNATNLIHQLRPDWTPTPW